MLPLLSWLACAPAPGPAGTDSGAAEPPADTGAGQSMDFSSAATCGECHPQHYDEWQRSMHAYATRSPVFQAMADKAFRDSAGEVGTFCTRCHSVIGDLQGEPGDIAYEQRSALGKEGVTCAVCHTAVHTALPLGNANLVLDPSGPLLGPYADASSAEHAVARSETTVSSELCGACHDVYMYPGLAIEQAYTEYVESPAAAAGVRCQDCHMSPEPGAVAERPVEPIAETDGATWPARTRAVHRFVGPDYALVDDFPYPDDLAASAAAQAEQLEQIQRLLENGVHIAAAAIVPEGEGQALEVVLENKIAAHRVPTGFTSERQLWLEVEVRDPGGKVVLRSGDLDGYGDLRDVHSWEVHAGLAELDTLLVNLQSENRTFTRDYVANGQFAGPGVVGQATFPFEAQEIVRHSLEPLEQRAVRYPIPSGLPGPCQVSVRLRYRNLPPYVLRALQVDELVDRLHIFDLDQHELSCP